MATSDERQDDKLDTLLEHILEIKVTLARFEGEHLPARVEKLELAVHENDRRWSKYAGMAAGVGLLGGGFLGALAKKLGLSP